MASDSSRSFDRVVSRSSRSDEGGVVSLPAGDGVTLIVLDTDPAGGLMYHMEGGKPRMLQIGDEIADLRIGIIDTARFLIILDLAACRLKAFCTFFGGSRIYFFGQRWGQWLDESGELNKSPDMINRMKSHRVPVAFNLEGTELTFEININPHFRAVFSQDASSAFDYGANSHQLQFSFDVPSGKFKRAKVLIQKERGRDASGASYGVRGFPLIWPEPTVARPSSAPPPRPAAATPPRAEPTQTPPPRPASSPQPASAGAEEPLRIKLAPKTESRPASADPGSPDRVKLRPKSSEFSAPPQPTSAPPPRASLRPRSDTSDSGEYSSGNSSSDSGPQRIKLRPSGAASSSSDSGGFRRAEPSTRSSNTPPESPAGEWIDDLLSGENSSDRRVQEPIQRPAAPEPPPPPKQPTPGMQASKKGVLTIPIQQLPIDQLIERIEGESDAETKWKMIEQNLILGREERTYQLVSRYAEIIHERTPAWPPARLKLAFGRIPGGILFGVMHFWKVNQIMAVSEENPESEKIMIWLRERELDRMLNLDTSNEVTTLEAARRDLCLDKNADEAAIKKTWRTLLSFLNADHGRQDERAIHRRKDEIAKHLQVARNVILRLK